ncbi:hypothetical protein GCM10028801_38980 [Nocardioides maradonensis]
MAAYDVVLALHIIAALAVFGMSTLLHGCEWMARRARTVAELRPLGTAMGYGFLMPVLGTTLVALGVVLVLISPDDEKVGFGDPFVWSGLIAYALLTASGAVMAPYSKAIAAAVAAAPDGPIGPELRAVVLARPGTVVGHMTTALLLAVVVDMTTKPDALVAPLVLLVGLGVGYLVGRAAARPVADRARLATATR